MLSIELWSIDATAYAGVHAGWKFPEPCEAETPYNRAQLPRLVTHALRDSVRAHSVVY